MSAAKVLIEGDGWSIRSNGVVEVENVPPLPRLDAPESILVLDVPDYSAPTLRRGEITALTRDGEILRLLVSPNRTLETKYDLEFGREVRCEPYKVPGAIESGWIRNTFLGARPGDAPRCNPSGLKLVAAAAHRVKEERVPMRGPIPPARTEARYFLGVTDRRELIRVDQGMATFTLVHTVGGTTEIIGFDDRGNVKLAAAC